MTKKYKNVQEMLDDTDPELAERYRAEQKTFRRRFQRLRFTVWCKFMKLFVWRK